MSTGNKIDWLNEGLDVLAGFIGLRTGADAAADAARAQKEQVFKQWRHEEEGRELRWDKQNLDHAHLEQVFRDKVRNAEMAADFTDATNALKYRHQLTIRNREQASLEAQFAKSNALYDEQITANAR